jgi:FixJ family two-component response regulator
VLLADLTLPGQSGAELARALVRRQPTMQVILMSGYGTHAEIGEPIAGAQLLGKPVDLSALQQALAPWLSAGRPHGATHVA